MHTHTITVAPATIAASGMFGSRVAAASCNLGDGRDTPSRCPGAWRCARAPARCTALRDGHDPVPEVTVSRVRPGAGGAARRSVARRSGSLRCET
jgi:hypothetical protein